MDTFVTALFKLLYYLPESFVLATAALTYVDIKPPRKKLLVFSMAFGMLTFLVRDVFFHGVSVNGLHSLLLMISNIFLMKYIFSFNYFLAILCDLLFFVTIYIFEILSVCIFVLVGFPLAQFMQINKYYNFLGLIPLVFISFFVYFLQKNNLTLIPINKILEMIKK